VNPSTPRPIAVTGSTGVLGGLVAQDLAARGIPQRLLVRTPAKAPQHPRSTVHRFSYTDQAAARAALEGVDTLFMVSGAESADRVDQHRSFIDAAAAAGVQHLVYTSFAAAAPDAVFTLARDHHATEEHIRASGMRWTFLRNGFYLDIMEALVRTASSVGRQGTVAHPSSPAPTSPGPPQPSSSTLRPTPVASTTSPARKRSR
jgi:NAD(P)H dehydrogenase (quinone)